MSTATATRTIVWPTLRYRDAQAAITFLVEAFGFEKTAVYTGKDESIVDHAELRWPGGGGVMLGSARPESAIAALPPGAGSIYIVVDDPDALYARAKAAGATFALDLHDEDYGSREFTARDPEGVFWSFGTYPGQAALSTDASK
jgi:uncharacterized glyoxalase superfamily protein PhnB